MDKCSVIPANIHPISCDDFTLNESYQSNLIQEFAKKISQSEETVLKQLVKQLTGEEATIEHAKKLTKVYHEGEPMNYTVCYNHIPLGKVVFDFTKGTEITVTFKPLL